MKYEPKFIRMEGSASIELPEGAKIIHYENDGYAGLPNKLCVFGTLIYLVPQSSTRSEKE